MNKLNVFLLTVVVALSFVLGFSVQSRAQNKSYTGVMPFMTSGDRYGFFDQSNGRIYIYDNNFSQCLFVGQIQALGQAIQAISKS